MNAPAQVNTFKVLRFTDENLTVVKLSPGTYTIDGKTLVISGYSPSEVCVKDYHNICRMWSTDIITHYEDPAGEKLSIENYETFKSRLEEKGTPDDWAYHFADLDDEYQYRKFLKNWTAIRRTVNQHGDPLIPEVVETVLRTNNPFIVSMYTTGGDDATLFYYYRESAVRDIVFNTFKSLGMTYEDNADYKQTRNQKIWGNSTHSCIRFVCAFGEYVFDDRWDSKPMANRRGSKDAMEQLYQQDVREIESIIKAKYNVHFSHDISVDKALVCELRSDLNKLRHLLYEVASKPKTDVILYNARALADLVVIKLRDHLAAQGEEHVRTSD